MKEFEFISFFKVVYAKFGSKESLEDFLREADLLAIREEVSILYGTHKAFVDDINLQIVLHVSQDNRVFPPFTVMQVNRLKRHQVYGEPHRCRSCSSPHRLAVDWRGFFCPVCEQRQLWAHPLNFTGGLAIG